MEDGSVGVLQGGDGISYEDLIKVALPEGTVSYRRATINELPKDRLFRNAWDDSNPEDFIGLDVTKAKELTHTMRRLVRDKKFKPYDDIIVKNIPGTDLVAAENAREDIRKKDAALQIDIDGANDEASLRSIIDVNKLKDENDY